MEVNITAARFFDITFVSGQKEVEPAAPVSVKIEYKKAEAIGSDTEVAAVHMPKKAGSAILDTEVNTDKKGVKEIEFTAESFSVYGIVYTVEFSYEMDGEEYSYSLNGGDTIGFRELMQALHILDGEETDDQETEESVPDEYDKETLDKFINNIAKMVFSDSELVKVVRITEDTTAGQLKEDLQLEPEYSPELTFTDIDEMNDKEYQAVDWVLLSMKSFESEETLTVTMQDGEVFIIHVTDPNADGSGTLIDSSNYVDVHGDGITVKLFDYSGNVTVNNETKNIDEVWGSGVTESQLKSGWGVNKGRTLLFTGSGMNNDSSVNWWNRFTGSKEGGSYYSGIVTQNIVDGNLVDGYPMLADSVSNGESLGYLFGAGGQDGVTVYDGGGSGLTGFLQKDSNGYYYYDSEQNYAKLIGNQISLYTDTYYKATGSSNSMTQNIGFFPFNEYNSNYTEEKTPNGGHYNHQFGMSLSANFTYPTDGCLPDANGAPDTSNPMVFDFEGDDDVWVYIDGVLVLDLGGVHSPVKGSINFATGVVTIGEFDSNGNYSYIKNTTIAKMFSAVDKTWNPEDYSQHKLDMFYLERGGCDSNLRLSFNLLTRTNTDTKGDLVFDKVDEADQPLKGAKFQLFTNSSCTTALTWTVEDEDGVKTAVAISTADETGNVKFSDVPTGNYYMKEIEPPEGYALSDRVYNVHVDATDGESWVKYNGETITKIVNHELKLTIKKVDDNGQPLNGAKFSLAYIGEDETTTSSSFEITASNGQYILDKLTPGNYVLTETDAPDGYSGLGEETVSFTVTTSEITLGDHPESVTFDGDSLVLTIPNTPDVVDDSLKVIKRWLDQNGNIVSGGSREARVKIQRKSYTAGSEAEEHNIDVNLFFPAYSDWLFDAKTINLHGSAAGSTVTLLFHFFGGNSNVQYGFTCTDSSVGIASSYPYASSGDYNWVQVTLTNVTQDITVNYTFGTTEGESAWVYNNATSIKRDFTCTGDGNGGSSPTLEDDDTFNALTDSSQYATLSSAIGWAKTWTIGGTDSDYSDYDFPAADDSGNAYRYYVVEVDDDGKALSAGEDTDLGYILYGYSSNNTDGISQGVITVYNKVDASETIDIIVKKTDNAENSTNYLEGAIFKLEYKATAEATTWTNVSNETVPELDSNSQFTVPREGITLTGLADGVYRLHEIISPTGYVITESYPVVFTVSSGAITSTDGTIENVRYTAASGTADATFIVPNTPGVALPSTGGIGTTPFRTLGATLVTLASLLYGFITFRKSRKLAIVNETPRDADRLSGKHWRGGGGLL